MWYADTSKFPRSGWTFKDPINGVVSTAGDYRSLITVAANKRKINHVEVGDIEQEVNVYLCQNNPPNFCQDARGVGDMVYAVAHPIAEGIDRVLGTNLANCTGCARRRTALNKQIPL